MSLALLQIATAIGPNLSAYFGAVGGTSPYVYSVKPGGAGGTINSITGLYHAPAAVSPNATQSFDVVQVRDNVGAVKTASILVTTPLGLLCDILQTQMNLPNGRVYFWDQKIFQPTDNDLYIAVSVPSCKPFGNNINFDGTGPGLVSHQSVYMMATVDIDIISRGPAARDRKEEVLMALMSFYSERQQEANSFYISRLPAGGRFINLSLVDGAAIPYRFKISFNMQYAATGSVQVNYFDTFQTPTLAVNS